MNSRMWGAALAGILTTSALGGCAASRAVYAARETHAGYQRCSIVYVGATDYGPVGVVVRQGISGRILQARQVQAQGCGAWRNYLCAEVDTGYGIRWQCVPN